MKFRKTTSKNEIKKPSKRFELLDSIRGLCLISMIIYHAVWDIVYIFGKNLSWFESDMAYLWQQSICCGFILISGFCSVFGKNRAYRGIKIILCSFIISLFTILFMKDSIILFGVLSLIGSGILFVLIFEKIFSKINPFAGVIIYLMLFILTKNIDAGFIGIGNASFFELPDFLYKNLLSAYFGFPPKSFISYDYFPLIPWLFLYFSGYFIFRIFKKYNLIKFLYTPHVGVLDFFGRHSLIIYMLHQPVLYLILYLLFSLVPI